MTHYQYFPCTYFYQVGVVQIKFYYMFDVPSALTATKTVFKEPKRKQDVRIGNIT